MPGTHAYTLPKLYIIYPAWWLIWAILQTFVLHRMQLDWPQAIADALVSNLVLAFVCLSVILLFRFYTPGFGHRVFRLVVAIIVSVAACEAINRILILFFSGDVDFAAYLNNATPVRFAFVLLMLTFINVLNWFWKENEERRRETKRQTETEQLAREAELAGLRQQLQPHFLFNSLNSISALAGSQPELARKMIQQLSDFLRGTLKKDEQKTVPLSEEMAQLNLYLGIEKVRFGERLTVEISMEEKSAGMVLPPLLLQPIIENAIKFGLYGTIEAITVSVKAGVENNYLWLEVKNPCGEQNIGSAGGTGFGLSSVHRRLFLLYSRNDLLVTEKKENEFIARLKIPQAI